MVIGISVPFYIDQFYPQFAMACVKLLQKVGCMAEFPINQTCCCHPMANVGCSSSATDCDKNFIKNFKGYDHIVAPSGSSVLHIKEQLQNSNDEAFTNRIRAGVYELTEFIRIRLHCCLPVLG